MQYAATEKGYLIRLSKGEELASSVTSFCEKNNIHTAFFQVIGAVAAVELAYYHLDSKEYSFKQFEQELEIFGITGNVALVDGKPFVHMHGSFGDENFQCHGGHVKSAIISATGEVYLVDLEADISRKFDKETGLKLLQCTLQ